MGLPYKRTYRPPFLCKYIVMLLSRMWSRVSLTIALTLSLSLTDVTATNQAALIGSVYCDTCFHRDFSHSSHFISGALVAVECGGVGIQASGEKPRFREEVKTDEKGEFKVKLPFEATKHVNEIKGCLVKLVSSSEPDCAVVAPNMTSSSIRLKRKTPENHVFSAGFFIFQPLQQPKRCQVESRNSNDEFGALTPLPSPADEMIPPVNDINNPGIAYPLNQFLPPSLVPSVQFQPPPDSMFTSDSQPPPDSMFNLDFQPPPASLQPPPDPFYPFQPSPPSLIPPMFFTPPPPQSLIPQLFIPPPPPPPLPLFPSLPFPPVDSQPDLVQSMTPPPPSMFLPEDPLQSTRPPPPPPSIPQSVVLPPFPFQPSPGLPRMPPTTSSAHPKKKHQLLD